MTADERVAADAMPARRPAMSPARLTRTSTGLIRALTLLRVHGVQHDGFPSFVGKAPLLDNAGVMRLGSHVAFRSQQARPSLATGPAGALVLGDRTFVNQGAVLHAECSVSVGAHVLIGDYVAICDTDFHEVDPGAGVTIRPVVIGDNVWLARSVVVLPGSTIGEGTVVAAGSVVRGELPAWVVAAGCPARPIRDITTRGVRR